MKLLKPVREKAEYSESIEKEINKFFVETFYKPIHEIIESVIGQNYNTSSYLLESILAGAIQYVDGKFSGKFNIRITKELKEMGAKYNANKETWSLPQDKLPMDIRQSISVAYSKFSKLHNDIDGFLQKVDIDDELMKFDVTNKYNSILEATNKDFEDGIKKITIAPTLTKETIINIANEYSNNLKLYIKKWSEENITRLRKAVYANTFEGYRAENLVKSIKANYNVSLNKAKFLARQETSLLVATYRENRFKSIGCKRYKWSTSGDVRVRDSHKALNGKIFFYDSPPVSGENGERLNPSKPFGCRCIDIPIWEGE